MSESDITVARVYLHEGGGQVAELLKYLHDESKVRGVTVFRGITGFGSTGKFHSSTLMDLSLDLPVVVEFFDDEAKVDTIIQHLNTKIKPGHIIYWPAKVNVKKE